MTASGFYGAALRGDGVNWTWAGLPGPAAGVPAMGDGGSSCADVELAVTTAACTVAAVTL